MKVGDYIRTKKRGFQPSQIARIKSMKKDSGYHNQYCIELGHNLIPDFEFHIYEEDVDKSSPDIIDLIEVGDYVNGLKVSRVGETYHGRKDRAIYCDCCVDKETGKLTMIYDDEIKSIVTKEQFSQMEYRIEE